MIATADSLVQKASTGFGVPMASDDFVWGSNGVAANQGVWLLNAYYLTGNAEYFNAAVKSLDYLVGKNPLHRSYVTGFGVKTPKYPHHRISQADSVKAPVPGMLVGGPQNSDNSDVSSKCPNYKTAYPATSYLDSACSYATNEVAINWNAPLAYLAGALEALASGETPAFAQIPTYTGRSSSSSAASSSSAKSSSSVKSSSSSKAKSSSSSAKSSSSVKSSSSSKAKSSSSSAKSSSSVKSSSSSKAKSSSSSEKASIAQMESMPKFSVDVVPNGLVVSGAKIGSAYALMDLQGRVIERGRISQESQFVPVCYSGRLLFKIQSEVRLLSIR